MPPEDISRVRRELEQLKRDMENAAPEKRGSVLQTPAAQPSEKSPLMDFGLFLLSYFFWLIIIVTVETSVGAGINEYTVFFAVPFAWLTIAWLRKAPLYALLITALGVLALIAAAYAASLLYDTEWDSNCYHKPVTGMLVHGWNPFKQTMIEFANSHDVLPYNSGWLPFQVNNQPKASFMIGASVYALTGSIEYGKIFNMISMLACVCVAAPMLRDAFRLNRFAAMTAMLLACANLITVSQIALYYNDGFTYQMLTVAAVSFAYGIFRPRGAFVKAAKTAAFLAACIAVNVKTSAVLYVAVLSAVYIIARFVQIRKSDAENRKKEWRNMGLYFAAMAVCAVCVLGASTYVTNFLRYGNPFYGMLGQNSMNSLLASLMSLEIQALPLFAQFFASMFSPTANALFTQVDLKIPFTFSRDEWTLATMDANVSGWGILFSGIFLLSVVIILVTAVRMRRRSPLVFRMLLGALATVIIPVFFIPYLFSARYYLQPFWVPLTALVCLFAPGVKLKQTGEYKYPLSRILKLVLAPALCILLMVNAYTGVNYLRKQVAGTADSRQKIAAIKERLAQGDTTLDVRTIARGWFYGLFFDLQDEGIAYNYAEILSGGQDGLLYYLMYSFRESGGERYAEANSFLYSLRENGYLVAVAANGGGPPTAQMTAMLQNTGLMLSGPADPALGYLAVIGADGTVRYEQSGYTRYQDTVDGVQLLAESAEAGVSVSVDGMEYAGGGDGFHIVVYDTVNGLAVYSVVIDPQADPAMTALPVRIAGDMQ